VQYQPVVVAAHAFPQQCESIPSGVDMPRGCRRATHFGGGKLFLSMKVAMNMSLDVFKAAAHHT